MIDGAQATGLASFQHRKDYREATGRDRWTVRAVNEWVSSVLPPLLERAAGRVRSSTSGVRNSRSGRSSKSSARRYVGMDVVQNSTRSVEIVSTLEQAPSPPVAFAAILCTEVLEHVVDIDAAFAGLRRLIAADGVVVLTVPFVFPLHMEPYDFRRLTLHGIRSWPAITAFASNRATRARRASPTCWRRCSPTRPSCRRRVRCIRRSRSARCGRPSAGLVAPARLRRLVAQRDHQLELAT